MPSIAVQCEVDPRAALGLGVRRIYVGERSCPERFLHLVSQGGLREALEAIRGAGCEAGLTTPILVPEGDRESIAEGIDRLLPGVDVLQTGDLGLAARYGGRVAITFQGAITNVPSVALLVGMGIRHVRLTLPYPRLVRDLASTGVVEVQVFGSIPANFTSICLWRTTHRDGRPCDPRCVDQPVFYRRGADTLVLRAKGLMTQRILDRTPRPAEFEGAATLLVDGFGLSDAELSEAVSAVREGRPCRTTRSRFDGPGDFVEGDVFRSAAWRRCAGRTAGE